MLFWRDRGSVRKIPKCSAFTDHMTLIFNFQSLYNESLMGFSTSEVVDQWTLSVSLNTSCSSFPFTGPFHPVVAITVHEASY